MLFRLIMFSQYINDASDECVTHEHRSDRESFIDRLKKTSKNQLSE